jgi:hypothetical protein
MSISACFGPQGVIIREQVSNNITHKLIRYTHIYGERGGVVIKALR